MEGIYLTEEGKQEIEAKIAKLDRNIKQFESIMPTHDPMASKAKLFVLKEILSSATILPVENIDNVFRTGDDYVNHYIENIACLPSKYPNGVIIKT